MLYIYPNYYKNFKCIADKCKHNCCIGWEIDIDGKSAEFYKNIKGDFGKRLKENISEEGTTHFILGADERCPFLNNNNLCDIIINLGEKFLCDICAEHPRFKNELPKRTEIGIGMACEEAARLILSQKEKFSLTHDAKTDDEIIILRDRIIEILQKRDIPIEKRIDEMLKAASSSLPEKSNSEWADIFLSLERLDEGWTTLLNTLKATKNADTSNFDAHMSGRQNEYEQFTVYLIYRHFANAPDMYEAAARASFAALGYKLLHALGNEIFKHSGKFGFDDQVELCRMFSSEIEYSDENVYILLDEIQN